MCVNHKIRNEFAYNLEYITNGLPVYLFIRQIAKILALFASIFSCLLISFKINGKYYQFILIEKTERY